MAKKFAHIKSISDVFNYEEIGSKKVYDPKSINHTDINTNTLCFVYIDEDSSDIGSYIEDYEIKAKDRYIICQGSIFAYVGEPEVPEDPGTDPETPEEYVWRPIYINNEKIENLEFNTDEGVKSPEKDYKLNLIEDTTELNEEYFNILDIKTDYILPTNTVSALFGINGDALKSFIEKVLPEPVAAPGNGILSIKANTDEVVNFSANQYGDTTISFLPGENIAISKVENNGIEISALIPEPEIPDIPEAAKDGDLTFVLEKKDPGTGLNVDTPIGGFNANQGDDTEIKFLEGDNIELSYVFKEGVGGLKISAIQQEIDIPEIPEAAKEGELTFVLEKKDPETGLTGDTTIGGFNANQEDDTKIKFLEGDNINLSYVSSDGVGGIKISAIPQEIDIPEAAKDGKLSFYLDEKDPETGESTSTTIASFGANQGDDTNIKFLEGDNINLSYVSLEDEVKGIKISAQVESPKEGELTFYLEKKDVETGETSSTTIGSFGANQEGPTNIKFLAGDNITLESTVEGSDNILKISGSSPEQQIYTTKDIIIAEDIEIGGTQLGDIIATENIFEEDIIPAGMSLHEVLVKILYGTKTVEEWGNQKVLAELKPGDKTRILITAKNYYTGEEIDLDKPLIELEEGTTILVTYTTEDPKVYQTLTVGPFIGGYALENADYESEGEESTETQELNEPETQEPTEPETQEPTEPDNITLSAYDVHEGDPEYLRIFDKAKSTFEEGYQNPSFDGFTKENVSGIGNNEIVLTVNKGWNNFSIKRNWSITPDLDFNYYYIYPISSRGNIGTDRGIEINNKLFFGLTQFGTLESTLQIYGITKELLPYYIGIVNNYDNIFDFSEGQEISSETLVSDTENGIRIEKQDTEAPSVITPTTQTDDLQLFIAVPANQFKTNDWLVSVVNTAAFNDNVTNIDDVDFKSKNLTVTIDDKPYYLWCISGKDEYSTFESNVYKITLNK